MMLAISTSHLSKTYTSGFRGKRQVNALQDFSLDVESGQIFSLLGPNGAGKTTFIKILLSLTRQTGGSAMILDHEVSDDRARLSVGYLPENHRYPGYLTGEQVLRSFGALGGVTGPLLQSRTATLLELVGMKDWRNVKVKKYSKGMMQRLGLAQAMINDPDLLFLDEPTDGVDPVGRAEIRDLLRNLKTRGKTIFLNSHLLSEVELISDRVAILDKGRLLRVGTVDELTTSGERYQVGIEGALPEAFLVEATAKVLAFTRTQSGLTVDVGNIAELNALIDMLRRHQVSIVAIAKERSTLEESFLSLIKREVPS
jgi:ABC-2 type transport system ATP-binding protein